MQGQRGEPSSRRLPQTAQRCRQRAACLRPAGAARWSFAHLKMRQFLNCEKNWLEGWSAQMTHLPMASASAVVVATTSLVEGFMNTCREGWAGGGHGEDGGRVTGGGAGAPRAGSAGQNWLARSNKSTQRLALSSAQAPAPT